MSVSWITILRRVTFSVTFSIKRYGKNIVLAISVMRNARPSRVRSCLNRKRFRGLKRTSPYTEAKPVEFFGVKWKASGYSLKRWQRLALVCGSHCGLPWTALKQSQPGSLESLRVDWLTGCIVGDAHGEFTCNDSICSDRQDKWVNISQLDSSRFEFLFFLSVCVCRFNIVCTPKATEIPLCSTNPITMQRNQSRNLLVVSFLN